MRVLVAVLLIVLSSSAAAEPAPVPFSDIHPTCKLASMPAGYDLYHHHTRNELIAVRPVIIQFVEESALFDACLRGALKALQAEDAAASRVTAAVIGASVTDEIENSDSRATQLWGEFNRAAAMANGGRSGEGTIPLIALDDSAQIVSDIAPPAGTRLSMPSYAVGTSHDCSRFYPNESKRHLKSGRVALTYDIALSGAVENVQISHSSGDDNLDTAALTCVRQWKSYPAVLDGEPVATTGLTATIEFEIW